MRIAACGHTSAHRPQSMQRLASQTGISSAIDRFSQRAVSVGKVPSAGMALTGSRSPRPAMISPVTALTNTGALPAMERRVCTIPFACSGTGISKSARRELSTA